LVACGAATASALNKGTGMKKQTSARITGGIVRGIMSLDVIRRKGVMIFILPREVNEAVFENQKKSFWKFSDQKRQVDGFARRV
tara:strand:- start:1791 stop:2042 length:252 start_codon:yes stop_codon:yes gene_type:complete